jgi:uncharacterized protein
MSVSSSARRAPLFVQGSRLREPGWSCAQRMAISLAAGLIRLYQWTVSPLLGPTCRFYPSCSNYALGALRHHGVVRGSWLTLRRLARCHPWHPGGIDFPHPHPHS